jgi:hypothetical protein
LQRDRSGSTEVRLLGAADEQVAQPLEPRQGAVVLGTDDVEPQSLERREPFEEGEVRQVEVIEGQDLGVALLVELAELPLSQLPLDANEPFADGESWIG